MLTKIESYQEKIFNQLLSIDSYEDKAKLLGSLSNEMTTKVCIFAAEKDDADTLLYILSSAHYFPNTPNQVLIEAAKHGNFTLVKALVEKHRASPICYSSSAICSAAESGYLNIVQYFFSVDKRGYDSMDFILPSAAKGGYRDVVIDLVEKLCKFNDKNKFKLLLEAGISASKNGNLNILKYLIEETGLDPSAGWNSMLFHAFEFKRTNIILYLNSFPAVQQTMDVGYPQKVEDLKTETIRNYCSALEKYSANYCLFFKKEAPSSILDKDIKQYLVTVGEKLIQDELNLSEDSYKYLFP
ncbi:MAG: ankyrin repeat domain-containing protein [Tatlockia sp.]|nr:ankyrin repeat domain-containing protein [Tatlockia sp.]